MSHNKTSYFQESIVRYWEQHGRHDLPWRQTTDPWQLIIAEVLLRKTTSTQAISVFLELKDFSPSDLEKMNSEKLELILKPIGLSNIRSRQLKEIARGIRRANDLELKSDEFLQSFPGIGQYISNTVRCFAFNIPLPALDSNMIRIIKRVFDYESDRKRLREDKNLWYFASTLVPKKIPRKYNWGILDFGSSVCTHYNPSCQTCVLRNICAYNLSNKRQLKVG